MALFLSWCIRIDAGRTGAKGQDVRLLLRHRQGQGLTSANLYVKCRLKSDTESANMRVAHIFAHGEKSAKRLKTKGIPQTQGLVFVGTQCDYGAIRSVQGTKNKSKGEPFDLFLCFKFISFPVPKNVLLRGAFHIRISLLWLCRGGLSA